MQRGDGLLQHGRKVLAAAVPQRASLGWGRHGKIGARNCRFRHESASELGRAQAASPFRWLRRLELYWVWPVTRMREEMQEMQRSGVLAQNAAAGRAGPPRGALRLTTRQLPPQRDFRGH